MPSNEKTARPAWSPGGFFNRVRMSRHTQLFIIVEGKATDVWFYEEILKLSDQVGQGGRYELFPVESASRGMGRNTLSGKTGVLALFSELDEAYGLVLANNGIQKSIAFCVDADHDRLTGETIDHAHLIYTELPDAEAHIAESVDLHEFGRRILSASSAEAKRYVKFMEGWREELAEAWRKWFELCLSFYYSRTRGPYPGTPAPTIDHGEMLDVDHSKVASHEDHLRSVCQYEDYEAIEHIAKERVDGYFEGDAEELLLKGKWLIFYLKDRSNRYARNNGFQVTKSYEGAREALKGASRFVSPWVDYYLERFHALVR